MLKQKTTKVQQYAIPLYQIMYQPVYSRFEIVQNIGGVGHVVCSVETIEQARAKLSSLQGGAL
jgi:hypothetical protein